MAQAWKVYGNWMEDPRVQFQRDTSIIDETLPLLAKPLSKRPAPKALGDLYLISMALASHAKLVSFDSGFVNLPGIEAGAVLVL